MTNQQTCAFIGHGGRISERIVTNIFFAADVFIKATDEPIFIVGGISPYERECTRTVLLMRDEYPKKKIGLHIVRPDEEMPVKWFDSVLICEEAAKYHSNPRKMKQILTQWMINHAETVILYCNKRTKPLGVEYAPEQVIINVS